MIDNSFNKEKFFYLHCKAKIIQVLRHIPLTKKWAKGFAYGRQKILSTDEGRDKLKTLIHNGMPFMAARFGTTEGAVLYAYCKNRIFGGEIPDKLISDICKNSGFFPKDIEQINKWAEAEIQACQHLDILGVMNFIGEEWIVRNYAYSAVLMPSGGLASAAHGWANVLEGHKVLVVHPFADTIQSQYLHHREEIFPETNALPLFDLQCLKAVQTIADQTDERFANWFEALDYMSDSVFKKNFDIALIGCGAYGFQLAARIKQMGKQVVHMGGCLQTLFGIKGSRWDKQYDKMYNNAWVYPSLEETPKGFEKVEGGCYWRSQ